ncbi:hypothetical protein HMPREF0372_01273 [Flavonifractor plautii ATCC 29863]|uniref:Uncharacterized protein n=1 Tax=Flavonifractor plautii ATCC 29863 TaxID=411475 RepID=G9YP44_FLAPL|nr:hypothetical protein HMPREF0372_01273 [Flavonifractor plautii ATCC 29863]
MNWGIALACGCRPADRTQPGDTKGAALPHDARKWPDVSKGTPQGRESLRWAVCWAQ